MFLFRRVCVYVCVCLCESLSCVQLFVTPWTVAHQACLSMGFPRQKYWSGLLFPSPNDLPNPGIEPRAPTLQADSLPLSHLGCCSGDLTLAHYHHHHKSVVSIQFHSWC